MLQFAEVYGFNYPQHVCTVVYGVGYSPSLSYYILLLIGMADKKSTICIKRSEAKKGQFFTVSNNLIVFLALIPRSLDLAILCRQQ